MSVYLTRAMLSTLNKASYPVTTITQDEDSSSSDHWQKLYAQGSVDGELVNDMICRVCAGSGCTPLLEKLTENCDILTGLRILTNISISLEDPLPKCICTECLETLKLAFAFKRSCEISDRKFRKILNLNPMDNSSLYSYPYSKSDFQLILHKMKLKRMRIEERREKERLRLERLLKKKNKPKKKLITCSPCDMTFSDKKKLEAHRRERQCMRRACDICGQLVLYMSQHRRHIHKQSTPHKCAVCGKEFPIIARLNTHMLVHTNTFNFYCDLCPYKCKNKYYLVLHMRTHTGEKPYKCPECPSTFVTPSNLNRHKLTHREKQSKCPLCEKVFRTNHSLREHHDAAHMNIKHTCSYCGRDFCYRSDLRKHEIRAHNREVVKRDRRGAGADQPPPPPADKTAEHAPHKWVPPPAPAPPPPPPAPGKPAGYACEQSKQLFYFNDVMQQQHQMMLHQQNLGIMPKMEVKKNEEIKMYATGGSRNYSMK